MKGRIAVVLVCVGSLSFLGTQSLADRISLGDENDAYGPLDVKRITHAHGRDEGDLVHKVITYGRWKVSTLRGDDTEILLLFTTDGDNKPERVLVVDAHGRGIRAEMHKWRNGTGKKIYGRAALERTGPKSVKLLFEPSLLGKNVTEYGWHVDTRFHDDDHPRCNSEPGLVVVCPDSAPNDNDPISYLRHKV